MLSFPFAAALLIRMEMASRALSTSLSVRLMVLLVIFCACSAGMSLLVIGAGFLGSGVQWG